MPGWIPMEAALDRAKAAQTLAAGGSLRLYQSTLTPTGATTKAEFEAAIATFDDYANKVIAAWYDPILAGGSAYILTMPPQQFSQGAVDPTVPNIIRGAYYLDSTGKLLYATRFAQDIPVQVANAGVPVEIVDVFTTGFVGVA